MKEWMDVTLNGDLIIHSELKTKYFTITVYKHPVLDENFWYLTSYPFFNEVLLESRNIQYAKAEAIAKIKNCLEEIFNEL